MNVLSALQSLGLGEQAQGPDGEKVLQQAQQVWSMLDDMVDKDPQAYERFIEKQKREYEEAKAPPKPHMCVRTKFKSGDGGTVYLNLMSWPKIPKPKSEEDNLPLFAAPMDTFRDKKAGETVSTIAIATNPEVIEQYGVDCKDPSTRHSFIDLCLDYVEHLSTRKVDRNFFPLPRNTEFKGDLEKAQTFFSDSLKKAMKKNKEKERMKSGEADNAPPPDIDIPESVISKLAGMASTKNGDESSSNPPTRSNRSTIETALESKPIIFPDATKDKPSQNPNLIQEIASEEARLETPEYTMEKSPSGDELTLRISLPGVTSVADCQLDISEDDVKLYVEGKYDLTVKLPSQIDDSEARAKFTKKQSTLTLHMPIANS